MDSYPSYERGLKLKELGLLVEIKGGDKVPQDCEVFDLNPSGDPKIGAQHFYHKHEWKAEQHFKELEGNTHIGYVTYKCECGVEATDKDLGVV